jgi:hypothetical protein
LTMTRIAHCCCGSLRAEATGGPTLVGACHCMECQRRTGAPFGVSTYFPKKQVRTEGPSKVYVRGSDSGRKIELHFCPNCGSTVFWYAEWPGPDRHRLWHVRRPVDALADGIRVGDDAASLGDFRSRTRSLWTSSRADRRPCHGPLVSAHAARIPILRLRLKHIPRELQSNRISPAADCRFLAPTWRVA